jgi:spermidine synthase
VISATVERSSSRALLPLLALLFFCSGASALVYQVLWLRMFGWVFGVTVYAASTVWGSFMAGLAAGSLLAAVVGDRVRRPLAWFGAAELVIGATAIASPALLHAAERAYTGAYASLPHSLVGLTVVRFVVAFAILIVPTTMMGATLPLVVKSSAGRGRLGERVGLLYGSNTTGAIVGTLSAGLWLIPQVGIQRTFAIAAALNTIVGVSAIALSRTRAGRAGEAGGAGRETFRPVPPIQPVQPLAPLQPLQPRVVVLVVFTLSGFVSLALEVVWFRVLTLFLRPTVYGFAVMLATILAGIAIGSYLISPWLDRRYRWIAVLALLEFALAFAVVFSIGPLIQVSAFSEWLTPIVGRVAPSWLAFPIAGSLLALFPAALLMGMAFPIGLRVWAGGHADESEAVARRIGLFYALNVAGAIAGSLIAGFLVLPWLGSHASLNSLAAVSFASGVVLLAVCEWPRRVRVTVGAAAVLLFGLAILRSPDPFAQFIAVRFPSERIVWRDEGIEATVIVHESAGGERSLTINGNHQASTDAGTTYVHRRIGHLPMALHPDPRTVLVIGLGGGATAGAVSVHGPSVEVVELSGSVVGAAPMFAGINYDVLSRPNVRLRVDDGRNFLLLTPKRYDVVTADVIHPIFAGSGNLYSAEYFRLMRRVLNPGGMVVQWVAGTDAEYKMIARTFLSVFPETTAWADGSLLVGTLEPLKLRRSDFERKLRTTGATQGFHDLNVESFDSLRAAFTAGPNELRRFVGEGPLLTDDKPVVEYFLSLPRDRDVDTSQLKALEGDVTQYVVEP